MNQNTRTGLPESVVSRMSGPPPEATQHITETKDTHPVPGQTLKFLTSPEIEHGPPCWRAGILQTRHGHSN